MIELKEAPKWKTVYESERAGLYDAFIFSAAMNYQGSLDAVLQMAARTPRPVRRVLDLGAGTGILTEQVLRRFPEASALAVDGSAAMLEQASKRLTPYKDRVTLDCRSFESLDSSLDGRYDLIVSSFALHHMDHQAMRELLRRLHSVLEPGGQLVVADYVLTASPRLQGWYEETWVEHRLNQSPASGKTKSQMMREHEATKAAEGDNPALLADLVAWTREAGFVDADCHWKYYCYAVYGGVK